MAIGEQLLKFHWNNANSVTMIEHLWDCLFDPEVNDSCESIQDVVSYATDAFAPYCGPSPHFETLPQTVGFNLAWQGKMLKDDSEISDFILSNRFMEPTGFYGFLSRGFSVREIYAYLISDAFACISATKPEDGPIEFCDGTYYYALSGEAVPPEEVKYMKDHFIL